MNLFYLRYFVKLAQVRHYTKAAEQLSITQPSLSHAISQLEAELGVQLFEKDGRNTTLTRFGEEFLVCAKQTLSTLDHGVASLQQSARGEGLIRLGFLRTLGTGMIPELASGFLAANPGKQIRFEFHSGLSGGLLDELSLGQHDLVFCSKPQEKAGFRSVPVKRQDLVLIVPKNHPLAARHSVALGETFGCPQVYFAKGSGLRHVVDEMYEKAGGRPTIALETEEDQVIAGLVSQGFGIAVVPYMDLLLGLDVKILQISGQAAEREFYMIRQEGRYAPPVVEQFWEYVLERTAGALLRSNPVS